MGHAAGWGTFFTHSGSRTGPFLKSQIASKKHFKKKKQQQIYIKDKYIVKWGNEEPLRNLGN